MSQGSSFSAEARGFANAARKKEQLGNKEAARKLYLKAAKSFLTASKESSTEEEKNFRKDLAQTFYGKAIALKQTATVTRKKTSSSDSSDESTFLPVEKPDITFENVGGLNTVKEEIKKAIVYPFQKPELYKMYGKKAGDGILLYGPPGCGKTFIARAAAGECNTSFLSMKISDILSKWLGSSERNIRKAFDTAAQYKPAILFFDEIDALGGKRSGTTSVYAKRVVNELLTALDGLEGPQEQLLTLAATNEPWAVDPALRRPGRFSKLILVPPPDVEARKQIFLIHLRERPVEPNLDYEGLSKRTEGYSSADIAQICTEAADIPLEQALKGGKPRKITNEDFNEVIEKRSSSLTPWFKLAKSNIKNSEEEETFQSLMDLIEKYI